MGGGCKRRVRDRGRSGRESLLRRRRHSRALRLGADGRQDGHRLLARRISAQYVHQTLSEALCRADGRDQHGGRRRALGAWIASCGDGAAHLRDAGDGDRALSGCGRHLFPAARAGRDGHVSRAHRRAAQGGGRDLCRARGCVCAVRTAGDAEGQAGGGHAGARGAGGSCGRRRTRAACLDAGRDRRAFFGRSGQRHSLIAACRRQRVGGEDCRHDRDEVADLDAGRLPAGT